MRENRKIWIAIALLWFLAAVVNLGFYAIDDYQSGVAKAIPAQRYPTPHHIIETSGPRSPVPTLVLWTVAQTAYRLGVDNPVNQLRCLFLFSALWSLVGLFFGCKHFEGEGQEKYRKIVLLIFGFHFLSPFVFSRTLVEVYSASWIAMSSYYLCRFMKRGQTSDSVRATVFLALAAQFRFQAGLCVVPLVFFIALKKKLRPFVWSGVAGLGMVVLIGGLDWYWKGAFLASLRQYWGMHINIFNSEFGHEPPLAFVYLFLGLAFAPALFSRYRRFNWKAEYSSLWPALGYFVFFVFMHSTLNHKEERFMIPVFPLFFVLITPLVFELFVRRREKWRWIWAVGLNTLLIVPTTVSTAQYNVIGLARYLNSNPQFKRAFFAQQTAIIFPEALIDHPPEQIEVNKDALAATLQGFSCTDLFAVRKDLLPQYHQVEESLVKIGEFNPRPLEAFLVRLNPGPNTRRGPIYAYVKQGCAPVR